MARSSNAYFNYDIKLLCVEKTKVKIVTMIKVLFLLIILWVIIVLLSLNKYELFFVDSARYADVARNFLQDGYFITKFSFPINLHPFGNGWLVNLPPLHIATITVFFKIFGISDFAVILQSAFFFILGAALVFLLADQLFGRRVAIFSAIIYAFTPQLLNYAKDGASEPIFIFELLFISYLVVLNKRWSLFLGGLILGLSIFTKLQSYIFIPIFTAWVILLYNKNLRQLASFLSGFVLILIMHIAGILFGHYSLIAVPFYLAFQQSSLFTGDDIARSGIIKQVDLSFFLQNLRVLLSKIFYNLYNFYKSIFTFTNLLPSWTSPLIVVIYLLSNINFLRKEAGEIRIFRFIVVLMVLGSFILAAATSPHIRYVHLTIPFIIILSVDFIDKILTKFGFNTRLVNVFMTIILVFFMVIPFLGTRFLDTRFNDRLFNIDKPYTHKVLGEKIGELTKETDIVATNLDSWGSWYGNRKTILIPLNIQGFETLDKKIKIDAIFLTDFQKDNQDHPLVGDWDLLYNTDETLNSGFVGENFALVKSGTISANEIYENQNFNFKLWLRNKQK